MGRIPGFKDTIFPSEFLPFINLVSTLGLIFFLFQVGLEVDMRVIRRDWRESLAIAVAGMALPFGLGIAVSVGLYKLQNNPSVSFASFMLFLGVAMAITVRLPKSESSFSLFFTYFHYGTGLSGVGTYPR